AGAARCHFVGNGFAGNLFDGADDLEHGGRRAGAEIVEETGAGFGKFVEDGDVGAAEIVDMHVVAEAGAVRRGIIVAEYLQGGAFAEGGVDGERDEVGFRIVSLADGGVLGGAGGIKVAEGGKTQTVRVGEGL